jgi:hypothetical protein
MINCRGSSILCDTGYTALLAAIDVTLKALSLNQTYQGRHLTRLQLKPATLESYVCRRTGCQMMG